MCGEWACLLRKLELRDWISLSGLRSGSHISLVVDVEANGQGHICIISYFCA